MQLMNDAFQAVEVIEGVSPLALAHFESPVHAMKFIRTKDKTQGCKCTTFGRLKTGAKRRGCVARLVETHEFFDHLDPIGRVHGKGCGAVQENR